jgi:hypothetical protein
MWKGFEGMERRLRQLGEVVENAEDAEKREAIRLLRGYLTHHRGRLGFSREVSEGTKHRQWSGGGCVSRAGNCISGRWR